MRMARSSANALAVVLIDRVASVAARASTPTWSTPGSPWRNRRSVAVGGDGVGQLLRGR